MYRKILVPLDGSKLAEQVLLHAAAVAKATGAEVTLVTVIQFALEGPLAKLEVIPEAVAERKAALKAEAMIYLEKVERELKDQGVVTHPTVLEGDVASEIIASGEQEGIDLVAMTTHGRGGIDRLVKGSIAEKVLRGTTRPVLLIRVSQ